MVETLVSPPRGQRARVIQASFNDAALQLARAPRPGGAAAPARPGRSASPAPPLLLLALQRTGGTGLPPAIQRKMESVFGADLSDVRIHVGGEASSIGALAFTAGSNVYIAREAYAPHTARGQELLARQIGYVLQQRVGLVANPLRDLAVVRDPSLERNAIQMAQRAVQGAPAPGVVIQPWFSFTTSVFQTAIATIAMQLGVDSSIAAIAAFIGIPTVALYAALGALVTLGAVVSLASLIEYLWPSAPVPYAGVSSPPSRVGNELRRRLQAAQLEEQRGFPPFGSGDLGGSKKRERFSYEEFKQYGRDERIEIAERFLASCGVTDYERQKLANLNRLLERRGPADEQLGMFYRYHKFSDDKVGKSLVFGGWFNKSEIDSAKAGGGELEKKALGSYFTNRRNMFQVFSGTSKSDWIKAMQKAQASALHSPFIATTSKLAYARALFREYPPANGQVAAILHIVGPLVNTFDFEFEFFRHGNPAHAANHYRETRERAKDRDQAEFGIPDLYIPIDGVSRFGFMVAHVEWLR